MRRQGRVEIGVWGGRKSKSERKHQAFLVTAKGDRLRLRRYDGPSMRDAVLEAMAGMEVVVEGIERDELFIATTVDLAPTNAKTRVSSAPPALGNRRRRRKG